MDEYKENHFLDGETRAQIHFCHIDWTQERPKMIDALKKLDGDPGRGYIIWRDDKPYILAGGYLVRVAFFLDEIAKQAEQEGQKLTANRLEVIWNAISKDAAESANEALDEIANRTEEEQNRIESEWARIEDETYINPFSAEETLRDVLEFGIKAHELTETDFSLIVEELSRKHPKLKAHIDRRRARLTLGEPGT